MNVVGLKVLIVIESSDGGSARHAVDLTVGLLQRGCQVEVAYSPLRAKSWFVSELEALPRRVIHTVSMQRKLGLHDLRSALGLRTLIKRRGPFDIIHGHSAKAGALIRLAGIGLPGRKVYTPHAFITLSPTLNAKKRLAYTFMERLLAKLGHGIICVSREERLHALELGLAEEQLFTVENGLTDLAMENRASARATLRLRDTDICLGFVGRISPQKSVSRLVNIMQALYRQHPDLIAVIVGDGPELETVKESVRSVNIIDRFRFTGEADGVFLMASFDIFVLPSAYEAFPYVYLEALARGLPIVTTDVGGASAVVDQGINGYIVTQTSLEPIIDAISAIAQDSQLRSDMGQQSRKKSKQFTIANMVDRTLNVYCQLLQPMDATENK